MNDPFHSAIKACHGGTPGPGPAAELLNHSYVMGVEVVKEEEKKLDPSGAVKMLAALRASSVQPPQDQEGLPAALRKNGKGVK